MQNIQDDTEGGLARRHRIKLGVAACALFGLVVYFATHRKPGAIQRAPAVQMVAVVVPPPPPPPPPPPRPRDPRPEPENQPQMIAQEAVTEPTPAPTEAAPSNDAPLGTGITGSGPGDGFGLGTAGGNGGVFGGSGPRGGNSGGRWGWYAGQVQGGIQSALAANPKTRAVALDARVRIWVDADGGIERVELSDASAPPEIVAAVREALTGLKLRQAAPAGMPMPIVLRINASRPL